MISQNPIELAIVFQTKWIPIAGMDNEPITQAKFEIREMKLDACFWHLSY